MSVYSYQPKGERGKNFVVSEKGEGRKDAMKRALTARSKALKAKHK